MSGSTQVNETTQALPTVADAVARDMADFTEPLSDYDDIDSRPDLDDDDLWPWDYPMEV